jgi:hypothetical protein
VATNPSTGLSVTVGSGASGSSAPKSGAPVSGSGASKGSDPESSHVSSGAASGTQASGAQGSGAQAAAKNFCGQGDLGISAGTAHKSFAVKAQAGLFMQVTNASPSPCRLDVADKHVAWSVYSGNVRVWGSHDCAIQAGSQVVTMAAGQTLKLTISWSGLTSRPKCAGTRMTVQAGTYRLFGYLNGIRTPEVTFTIK